MSDDEREDNKSRLVLSVDGGGFKGLACLQIVARLMERMCEDDEDSTPPKPCQIFDLICGTSTGGLISILLGRFGLSCEEAIEVYTEIGETMFDGETDSAKIWVNIIQGGKSSSAKFEKKLEDITARYTGSKDALFRPLRSAPDTVDHESTKTFVTVVSRIGSAGVDAYRIRSYPRPSDDIDPAPYGHKWTIFEGARGTCATPLYMTPLEVQRGLATYTFQDAGYSGFNNPVRVAMDEAEKLFGNDSIITLVSLGTGLRSLVNGAQHEAGEMTEIGPVKDERVDNFAQQILANVGELGRSVEDAPEVARRVAKQLLEVAADTEIAHLHTYEQFKREGHKQNYHRFNPPQGLGDLSLMDYKQEVAISSVTDAWLKSTKGKDAMHLATKMIKDHYELKQAKIQPSSQATKDTSVTQTQAQTKCIQPADRLRTPERTRNDLHNQASPDSGIADDTQGNRASDQDKGQTPAKGKSSLMQRLKRFGRLH